MNTRPINTHEAYHAHIYFDEETVDIATEVYNQINNEFDFEVGKFHKKPVGPHTMWMFQVPFSESDFDDFINWLEKKRNDLSILIHPLTGNNLQDHTKYASWLGDDIDLDLGLFEKQA